MSVQVANLTKRFSASSNAPAAYCVSFEAKEGQITTLLGPSGSGKSTVLRLIAGLEIPDTGSILIEGKDVTRVSARERGIGLVFQSYALFPHLTVRKNVGFGMRIRKVARREIDDRVEELLTLVQMTAFAERHPAQLSGGQRQRVALARALAVRPRVLLLDEPFGALDTQVRQELRAWLLNLHEKTKITTLLVTHDQNEALELSDQIVLLRNGIVIQTGTPREVYDRPGSPFVASFLGASVVSGTVRGAVAHVGGLHIPAPIGFGDGDRVRAFIRPHDVRISKAGRSDEPHVRRAQVLRVSRIGGQVKVHLQLSGGELVDSELSPAEAELGEFAPGDDVFVNLVSAKMFLADYAI